MKKLYNPILIPIISLPCFLLGCFLAAVNWTRLGFPQRGKNTLKWGIIGAVSLVIAGMNIPVEMLQKMWPIWIGINIGVGMALRTLQEPEYKKTLAKKE